MTAAKMLCGEREKLQKAYREAFLAKSDAGQHVRNKNGVAWIQATQETRELCEAAKRALKQHRAEHGC
jgi:predicted transcriptional regulator